MVSESKTAEHREPHGLASSVAMMLPNPGASNRGQSQRMVDDPCLHQPPVVSAQDTAGTQEQRRLVREVLATTDYYEILGCARGCSQASLKRAYHKRALELHPDKNPAAGAADAFKGAPASRSMLIPHRPLLLPSLWLAGTWLFSASTSKHLESLRTAPFFFLSRQRSAHCNDGQ